MKKVIQLLISILFLGAAVYVLLVFFYLPKKSEEKLKDEAAGKIQEINVDALVKRSFKTEQTDIFHDTRFQSLQDWSVELPPVDNLKTGKNNPFVPN